MVFRLRITLRPEAMAARWRDALLPAVWSSCRTQKCPTQIQRKAQVRPRLKGAPK